MTLPTAQKNYYSSLDQFLATLPALEEMTPLQGGSNAHLYIFTLNNHVYVLKCVRKGDGLIDGHDLTTFARQIEQTNRIHRMCPELSPHFAKALAWYVGEEGAALIMPFYSGYQICHLLTNGQGVSSFFERLSVIMEKLIKYGYLRQREAALAGTFERLHIQRVERRLSVLQRYLPSDLFSGDLVLINSIQCRPIPALLVDLRADTVALRQLDPPALYFPIHGDLNLDNILVCGESTEFTLLDPRGTLCPWDVIYDCAKQLFSLTALHSALRWGFQISQCNEGRYSSYRVQLSSEHSIALTQASEMYVSFLSQLSTFRTLVANDSAWQPRLYWTHCFHVLASAASCIVNQQQYPGNDISKKSAQVQLALGFHLLGRFLLERMVSRRQHLLDIPDSDLFRWDLD